MPISNDQMLQTSQIHYDLVTIALKAGVVYLVCAFLFPLIDHQPSSLRQLLCLESTHDASSFIVSVP